METLVGTATRLSSDLTIFGMRRTTLLQDILYPEESKKKRSDFCESDLRKHADYGLLCAFHEQVPFVMQGILCGKLRIFGFNIAKGMISKHPHGHMRVHFLAGFSQLACQSYMILLQPTSNEKIWQSAAPQVANGTRRIAWVLRSSGRITRRW